MDNSEVTEYKCACTPGFRGSTCTGVVVKCGLNEFKCSSGECIPLKKQCDNIPYDCADNSDELNGECSSYDCKHLLADLDSLMNTCGNISRPSSAPLENEQNIWQFFPDFIDFLDDKTIISKIIVDVDPYMGTDISSDGTLFVALLSESENETPVFYFKISYQNGDGNTRFVKKLTDIYTMGLNRQLVSLSFLPDGFTEQLKLSYSKCYQRGACLTLETTTLINNCDKECIKKYANWRQTSDQDRNDNCEVTYIDSVIDPLYEQCLIQPSITMISANMKVNIKEKRVVSLYCVASGAPTPTVQWVNKTEPDNNFIGEPSNSQVIYQLADISSTTRFACHAENVLKELLSEDVVISLEDPFCTDFYNLSQEFSVSNSVCYNETVEKLSLSNETSDGLTYTGYLYGKTVLFGASLSSYSFSSKEQICCIVFSIEMVISNVMSGAVIYRQVFDGIINNHNSTPIHFSFDQPIKINSTSRYEFTLSITEPTHQLNSDMLEVKCITCSTGSQECQQFIRDWNGLISSQLNAGCDDIDAQYRAAELCFAEFFGDPEVIRHPKSQVNNVGLTSTLECNIRNVEFYNWYKNGKRIPSSGPIYTLQLEEEQDQGDYICLGFRSQDSKEVTSNIATVLLKGTSTFRVHVKFQIPYKQDYKDKESEVFKNFTKNLETALEGELLIPFRMFVSSIESGSVTTEMELYFTDQLQNVSAINVLINDSLLSLPEYETDPSSIVVMSISICVGEDVFQDGILYSFTDTLLGTTAESMQTCPLFSDQGITVSLATRNCGGDFVSGARWSQIKPLDCGMGNISRQIQNINEVEVTENNVAAVADALAITTTATNLDKDSIMIASDILEDIVALKISDESVTFDVVEIVNNVIKSIELGTEFSMRETASSFVVSLEQQLATVAAADMNFTAVLPHVSVMTLSVSSGALEKGLSYVEFGDSDSADEYFEPKSIKTFFELTFPIDKIAASISLPPDIISVSQHQTGEDDIRVYFTVYQNTSLFISDKLANESEKNLKRQVGSHVISASIDSVRIGELVNPIKLAFLPRLETITNTECVFWDFSFDNGVGDWSNESCTYNGTADDRAICLCDHLTNFAILVDYYEPKVDKVLTIISLIGCIVSIVCLAITIFTYLFFRQFRTKRPKKILINLSISLFFLYLVFAIGIEKTTSKNRCTVVAALIHYFALASVFWMSIEAINMYLMFVRVFYDGIRYFMLKVCVLGYGAPLVRCV
ncbi:uncharacterized protein LOC117101410 [Anneissia japonica]|uniref:uncharacterized protein LOC117101410 n=1 Tax=Anneissia japonica TaxID=1529436 RepID=UPI001425A9EF|nr:uncharacterized protein LOC117101410 [Anneissia japonica]